ncbi:MAG: RpiB/LacA/LacB family sugar-phosphate isomerase, partial [Candidatus Pacebacteria bacterium]|nr:RpiB/LacA/LacB family sugar-phosphate isomerase [Candidatus Paceibacterota bacterium]
MQQLNDWYGTTVKIGVASDHGGYNKKNDLVDYLKTKGLDVVDCGPHSLDPRDDYPQFACRVARGIVRGDLTCGILLCRTGIGMSIAANRFHGIRAALVSTVERALASRDHNAANILVTGGDTMTEQEIRDVIDTWLATPYSDEARHTRRLQGLEYESYDDIAAVRCVDPEMAAVLDREIAR